MQAPTNHPGKIQNKYAAVEGLVQVLLLLRSSTLTPGNAGLFFPEETLIEKLRSYDSVFPESEIHVGAQQEVSDQPSHVQDKDEVE